MYKPVQIKPIRKVRKVDHKRTDKKEKDAKTSRDIDDMIFPDEVTVPSER